MTDSSDVARDAQGARIKGPFFLLLLFAALAIFIIGLVMTSDWLRTTPLPVTPPPPTTVDGPILPDATERPVEELREERDRLQTERDELQEELDSIPEPK